MLNTAGQLCRIARRDDSIRLLSPERPEVAELLAAVSDLLGHPAVQDALRLAASADPDIAGYDLWRVPLREIIQPRHALSRQARRYYAWPAHVRRTFERGLGALTDDERAEAQGNAYFLTVLGTMSDGELARQRGVSEVAVRMARSRACRSMRRFMGAIVESSHDL